MKNKKIIIFQIIFAAILAIVLILLINFDFSKMRMNVDLYFLNEDCTGIVAESREIKYKDDIDAITQIIEEMNEGPKDSKKNKILSPGSRLQKIEYHGDDNIILDFSEEYLTKDSSRNMLEIYAVTKSICSSGIVSRVKVTVNGNDIINTDGSVMDFIEASDINLETEEFSSELRDVVLYFADSEENELVREERTIKITDQQPIEQYIINELIKGPYDKEMCPLLSKDTSLVSVTVQDNICYLNFMSDFIKKNEGDQTHETLVIYSIVNSLTELNTISRVQFYMDGKRIDNFGSVSIKGYISRDTSIIREE